MRSKLEMYDPKGNGKDIAVNTVEFVEVERLSHLRGIVHRFLVLKTNGALADEYKFHALPDACTYIIFDQLDKISQAFLNCAPSRKSSIWVRNFTL